MVAALRSELTRMGRKGVLGGWLGMTALLAALINSALFSIVADSEGTPENGPGVAFPSLAELAGSDGLVAGMSAGASMFGVVALAFWAVVAATDWSTGLVRLLVSAQPSRWRLLAGKVGALTLWTAGATTVALVVTLVVAPVAAESAGIATDAWRDAGVGTIAGAWLDLFTALVVWGAIGLVVATLTRSSAVAIACGVGYLLVVEAVVEAAAEGLADWLPGNVLEALAQGGTDAVPYGAALALGAAYLAGGLVLAAVVTARRDVTD